MKKLLNSRRQVQIVLGILWLLDGVLQLQHRMLTSSFAQQVILPAAQGQPSIVRIPLYFEAHLILLHPVLLDVGFALFQLLLGVLILIKKTSTVGIVASVGWALGIWYFGEGLGGLLGGHASLLTGAPGAAVLYAFIGLATLKRGEPQKRDDTHYLLSSWLAYVWAGVWLLGTLYRLLPGQNLPTALATALKSNVAQAAPHWLNNLELRSAHFVLFAGYPLLQLLIIGQLCIGIFVLASGNARKAALLAGISLSFIFWVVGQSMGAFYTGIATDPNTGPLLILMGISLYGAPELPAFDWHVRAGRVLKSMAADFQPDQSAYEEM